MIPYPSIDMEATGARIAALRKKHHLSVMDVSSFMGFENPQAVYKWQKGYSLPTLDNMYALSILFEVSINDIIVNAEEAGEASSVFCGLNCRFNDNAYICYIMSTRQYIIH